MCFHTIEDYSTYYDKLPELVWVTDSLGNVIFLNECYKSYVGIEDIANHNWIECLHPNDIEDMSRERALAFKNKSIFHTHYRLMDRFGVYKWFLSRATPMFDQNREVIRWFGVNTDINDKIEAIEKEKNQNVFFGANTHDLKTPITGILGLTELLLQTDLTFSQREDLKSILQCGLNVLNLITKILDFCRIESKKLELDILPFNIELIVEHIVKLARMTKNQHIELDIEDSLKAPNLIKGDAGRVTQVLTNLVTNAVKFTPSDGRITLTVALIDPATINENVYDIHSNELNTSSKYSQPDEPETNVIYVECRIDDNGSGIDTETMCNLFDPFTQSTNQNRAVSIKGHGLGLYICKNLMTLMKGHISVDSEPGRGTTFRVAFPYQPDFRQGSHHSSVSDLDIRGRNYGIMIVEDNVINRNVATRFLERENYRVYAYPDGIQAFEAFKQLHPEIDLILMDLHLPDIAGAEIAKRFREYETSLRMERIIPIIAFTASTGQSELNEALANGMNGVIVKPFIRKEFLRKILQTIRAPSVPDQ